MIGQGTLSALAAAGLFGALAIAEPEPQRTPQEARTAQEAVSGYHGGSEAVYRTPRMPYEQSAAIKRSMLPPGVRMQDVELDHRIPLCMGGSNDRSNLQLQPWPEARRKDELEIALCRAVSHGEMSREEAVRRILAWRP